MSPHPEGSGIYVFGRSSSLKSSLIRVMVHCISSKDLDTSAASQLYNPIGTGGIQFVMKSMATDTANICVFLVLAGFGGVVWIWFSFFPDGIDEFGCVSRLHPAMGTLGHTPSLEQLHLKLLGPSLLDAQSDIEFH